MRAWLARSFGDTAAYSAARKAYRGWGGVVRAAANRWPSACRVSVRGLHNQVHCRRALLLQGVKVVIHGDNNVIQLDPSARLRRCTFTINGSDNRIVLGASECSDSAVTISGNGNLVAIDDACMLLNLGIVCEDSGNVVTMGTGTQVHGSTELAAIEGTAIRVGQGCLFSGGIHFRTGDSHSITDLDGNRINQSKSIDIGDRVWVGRNVTILKGAAIAHSCVVGASAVVTKRFEESNCIVAGSPAIVVRRDIDWRNERISDPTAPHTGNVEDCA